MFFTAIWVFVSEIGRGRIPMRKRRFKGCFWSGIPTDDSGGFTDMGLAPGQAKRVYDEALEAFQKAVPHVFRIAKRRILQIGPTHDDARQVCVCYICVQNGRQRSIFEDPKGHYGTGNRLIRYRAISLSGADRSWETF